MMYYIFLMRGLSYTTTMQENILQPECVRDDWKPTDGPLKLVLACKWVYTCANTTTLRMDGLGVGVLWHVCSCATIVIASRLSQRVVNMELKMGKGKLAAQCCHGAVGCYKSSSKYSEMALHQWEWLGQAKICLKCPTESEMLEIRQKVNEGWTVGL